MRHPINLYFDPATILVKAPHLSPNQFEGKMLVTIQDWR